MPSAYTTSYLIMRLSDYGNAVAHKKLFFLYILGQIYFLGYEYTALLNQV